MYIFFILILKTNLSITKNTKLIGTIAKVADLKPEYMADVWATSSIKTFDESIERLINNPARIGPADAMPTRPKEFSSPLLYPFNLLTPRPRAIIKGVVIAPVVAPDASKAIAWPRSFVISMRIKITP